MPIWTSLLKGHLLTRIKAHPASSARAPLTPRKMAFLFLALLFLWSSAPPLSAQERVIRYGMMELPPLFHQGEDGSFQGFFPDLLRLLAEGEPWKVEFVEGHGDDLLVQLERGEIDLLSMASTVALERRFDYGKVQHYATWYTFYTQGQAEVLSFQDLEGKRIAMQGGFYAFHELRRILGRLGIFSRIVSTRTKDEAFDLLREGKVDVCVAEQMTTARLVRDYRFRRSPLIFAPSRIFFATTKGRNADLLNGLDEKLTQLQAGPFPPLERLRRRWFYDEELTFFPRWALCALAGTLFLLALACCCLVLLSRKDRIISQRKAELEERLKAERFLSGVAQQLLSGEEAEAIAEIFAGLRGITKARRLLLLRRPSRGSQRRTPEVLSEELAPGLSSWKELLEERLSLTGFSPGWLGALRRKKTIPTTLAESGLDRLLPSDAGGATPLVLYPLFEEGRLWGALALEPEHEGLAEATDLLLKTFCEIFSAHLRQQKEASRLLRLATTDPLTGLANRRYFFDSLDLQIDRFRTGKAKSAPSIILADIDHFKRVNDAFGHDKGDEALRQFAQTLSGALRRCDLAARLGGEEFAVLLPEATTDQAYQVALRLRDRTAERVYRLSADAGQTEIRMTASFGIATLGDEEGLSRLYQRADRALYEAKSSGRNEVAQADLP